MNDRLRQLAELTRQQAEAEVASARDLLRRRERTLKALDALVRGWSLEDEPDGPLFGGLRVPTAQEDNGSREPTPASPASPPPARQFSRLSATVETVREWWVYRKQTTDRLGEVLATTEPSALVLAIDRHGPDVWIADAGGEVPARQESSTGILPAEPPPQVSPAEPILAPAGQPDGTAVGAEQAAWEALAAECPDHLDRFLHQAGQYLHGLVGGVLDCWHQDDRLPDDWTPSQAQQDAWAISGQGRPGQPVPHPSWANPVSLGIHLDPDIEVRVTWTPALAPAQGCGVPGRLELRGPVSATGYRGFGVPLEQRRQPLEEAARDWAQHYVEAERNRAGHEKLPQSEDKYAPAAQGAAARAEDLASGVAKPRVRKRVKKSAAKVAEEADAQEEGADA